MFVDNIKLTGKLSIKKYDDKNNLIEEYEVPNLVVTSGKAHVAQRVAGYVGSSASVMTHMAIGTNNTAPVAANTSLTSQLGSRVALDSTSVSAQNITFSATFGPLAEYVSTNIVEAGVFNASTGGTMLCRTTFPIISKTASETIAIVWTVTVG